MNQYLTTLALAVAAAIMTPHAHAETVVVYHEGQLVNPQDVAAVLGHSRGIRLLDSPGPTVAAAPARMTMTLVSMKTSDAPTTRASHRADAPVKVAAAEPTPMPAQPESPKAADASGDDASALSLPVRFAFDSAEIMPAAEAQLDALAAGIKMLPPDSVVTVEATPTPSAPEAYNLELSRMRARAVRDYLVQHDGIDGARLKTVGYGEDRPIEGSDPRAAVNRRVQFRGS